MMMPLANQTDEELEQLAARAGRVCENVAGLVLNYMAIAGGQMLKWFLQGTLWVFDYDCADSWSCTLGLYAARLALLVVSAVLSNWAGWWPWALGLRAAAREGNLHARYRSFFLFPGPSGSAGLFLASRHWHVAKRAQTQNCTKCPGHGFPLRLGSELLSGSAPFPAPGRVRTCFFPALSVPARRLNRGGDVVCDFFAL